MHNTFEHDTCLHVFKLSCPQANVNADANADDTELIKNEKTAKNQDQFLIFRLEVIESLVFRFLI